LLHAGAQVTIYDNFSAGRDDNLTEIADHVTVVHGDILDYDRLRSAMSGHDAVSHQAAQLEITRSIDDPIYDLQTNTIGTINVLKAVAETGIPKVVAASSAGVYGQAVAETQDENHPTEPNWEYGVSKLACEKYAAIYCERTGMSVISLRYAIVYGEREWYGRVLTIFLKRALERMPPVIFGKGDQVRDFVYVGDIASLHRLCLETETDGHVVLNGSTGVCTSISRLAALVCDVAGLDAEPLYEDVSEGMRSKLAGGRMRLPSELQAMCMSYAAARAATGWQPLTPLREGLRRQWDWLGENIGRWTKMSY
jgi:UDP-glucose 4-epimerase